jgi:hypothetical protein
MAAPTITQPRFGSDPQRALTDLATSTQNGFNSTYQGIAGGVLVPNVLLKWQTVGGQPIPVDTPVVHNLGQPSQGYMVVGTTMLGLATCNSTQTNKAPNTQLLITHNSTGNNTASFWVF